MSFDQLQLVRVGYKHWFYKTTDDGDTVNAAGYFNLEGSPLRLGDIIKRLTVTGIDTDAEAVVEVGEHVIASYQQGNPIVLDADEVGGPISSQVEVFAAVNGAANTDIGSAFEPVLVGPTFEFARVGQIAWIQGFCITTKNGATAGTVAFSVDQSDGTGAYETFPGMDPDNVSDAVEYLPGATNAVENEGLMGHFVRCSTPGTIELTLYAKSAGVASTCPQGDARISVWLFP